MLLIKAKVGRSSIHDLGLIAQEFIPNGTIIWRLDPSLDLLISEEEFSKLTEQTQKFVLWHSHFDQALNKYVLPADDDRFANHSENANTKFFTDHSIAVRDIYPGEEITDNYNDYGKSLDFVVKSAT